MIARRLLALAFAASVLPAAAQAHWVEPCGCQRAHDHAWRYHHHHHWLHERTSGAVELTENVFAVPYHLRHYPYVSFGGRTASVAYESMVGSGAGGDQVREIDADAKVTILGPNRMDIRLYRKGRGTIINPR